MNEHTTNVGSIKIALDDTIQHRPVNTQIFMPFLIARLMEHPAMIEQSLEYQVTLQDIGNAGTRLVAVKWTWTADLIPPRPLAAQPEFISEAAAYAMAFAVVSRFTSARLIDVAE